MSNQLETRSAPAVGPADGLSAAEAYLGNVLALIHRALPRLEEAGRATEVQTLLAKAAKHLESAREAHAGGGSLRNGMTGAIQTVATGVDAEIAAVIAAAVAVLFDRPYRLISVQPASTPVPHLNVWALEGRTQIFQSHRIR